MKSNYGLSGTQISMTWVDGFFIRDPDDVQPVDQNGAVIDKSQMAEDVFMKLLRKFELEYRNVSANPGITYAPSAFAKHPQSEGVKNYQFKRAMEKLLSNGTIKQIVEGPPSKRRARLIVSADNPQYA